VESARHKIHNGVQVYIDKACMRPHRGTILRYLVTESHGFPQYLVSAVSGPLHSVCSLTDYAAESSGCNESQLIDLPTQYL